MDEATFESRLNELVNEIGSVPAPRRNKLIKLARNTGESHKRLRKSVDNLQGSLDHLRLSVKYLIFDLEATRRENAELKNQLRESK